jgi:hypothetical protein
MDDLTTGSSPCEATRFEREVNCFVRGSPRLEEDRLSGRRSLYDDRDLFFGRAERTNLRRQTDDEGHHGDFEQIALREVSAP